MDSRMLRDYSRAHKCSLQGKDSEQAPEHLEVQRRNPDHIGFCIPEVWLKEILMYEPMISGICGIDTQKLMGKDGLTGLNPEATQYFCLAMLMVPKVAHVLKIEWVHLLLSTSPNCAFLSKQQFSVLGYPKSVAWDKNQRLALEFTEGVINRAVSDELFALAEKTWGSKRLALFARWISYYAGLMMFTAVNITDAEINGELSGELWESPVE